MTVPLDTLELEGYKCFERLRVPLAPLTLFTGFNGAGKSTALQPLLLLAQAARSKTWGATDLDGDLPLNGEIVRLGSAGDVMRADDNGATRFAVGAGGDVLSIAISARTGDRVLRAKTAAEAAGSSDLIGQLERLVHLSAVRGGPFDGFPIPDRVDGQSIDVGVDGRYASHWYHELADTEITPDRCAGAGEGRTFRRQLDAWLGRLAPGANANVQRDSRGVYASITISTVRNRRVAASRERRLRPDLRLSHIGGATRCATRRRARHRQP